jgi:hypothetical protein
MWTLTTRVGILAPTTARGRFTHICTPSRGERLCLFFPLIRIKLIDSSIGVRARYIFVPSPSTARLLRENRWCILRVVGRGVDGGGVFGKLSVRIAFYLLFCYQVRRGRFRACATHSPMHASILTTRGVRRRRECEQALLRAVHRSCLHLNSLFSSSNINPVSHPSFPIHHAALSRVLPLLSLPAHIPAYLDQLFPRIQFH